MPRQSDMLKVYAAPLQGFTEAPWRSAHARVFGGVDCYYTPFMRVEKGVVRSRDLNDALVRSQCLSDIVPQAIFSGVDELAVIVSEIRKAGIARLDLNMGCPFPPQCRKGRGAAMIVRPDVLRDVIRLIGDVADICFSVKMRLGLDDPKQWRSVLPILNQAPLCHIVVHPRIARQQYAGNLLLDEFRQLLDMSRHPVIFNGDLRSVEDISCVAGRFSSIAGVMLGRGLLSRPSLAAEWRAGELADDCDILAGVLEMHRDILGCYSSRLCGDAQLLAKIKPFWDYLQPLIGRKAWKAIHKATSIARYNEVVAGVGD